jgi:hypothetical protein
MNLALLILIGFFAGLSTGVFGIGGGIIIVPGLVYLLGYPQHLAVGTSLAVLLPPVGLAAVLEYYRRGNVEIRSALVLAAALILGSWLSASLGNRISASMLKTGFGCFLVIVGCYTVWSANRP